MVLAAFGLIGCGMAMVVFNTVLSILPPGSRVLSSPAAARLFRSLLGMGVYLSVFAAIGLNFYIIFQALARIGRENHEIRERLTATNRASADNQAAILAILETMRARYGAAPSHPAEEEVP